MNHELRILIENYLNKYHITIIENNPIKEYNKFYFEHKDKYLDENPIMEIYRIIDSRLISKEKIVNNYKQYYSYSNNIKGVNELKEISSYIYRIKHSINATDLEEDRMTFSYYYMILYIALASSYPIIKIDKLDKFIYLLKYYKTDNGNDSIQYYRGQSNSKWNIIPSCLRNLNFDKTHIYKYKDLLDKYDSINVLKSYNEIIDYNESPYPMISFFQHSISYSPLVDFTSKLEIATFFALSNYTNINSFFNEDAAIFVLQNHEEKYNISELKDSKLENMKIGIYTNKKRTYSDYALMYTSMGRLFGTNAQTYFSGKRTNDRMRYQSGAFILFDNYIIDDIYSTIITISSGHPITKIVIDKSIKKDLLKYLNIKYPDYKLRYLMNPYLKFEESEA